MTFGGEGSLLNIKFYFLFSVKLPSETILIITRIQRHVIINVNGPAHKVPVVITVS